MYLKVERSGTNEWLLNGGLIKVSLDTNRGARRWFEEQTNAWNDGSYVTNDESVEFDVINKFLQHGFTPLFGCFGTKIQDSSLSKPIHELRESVSWFLFDGISDKFDDYVMYYESRIYSIAVNYDSKNNIFTVYRNTLDNKKRIGVYDDMSDVFDLVDGYLPVKVTDRANNIFEIDWEKVTNSICYSSYPQGLGVIHSCGVCTDLFEKRLGHIINRINCYMKDTSHLGSNKYGLVDDPKKYIKTVTKENGKTIILFILKDEGREAAWISFEFNGGRHLSISLHEWYYGSFCCVENIMADRETTFLNFDGKVENVKDHSKTLEDEAIAYLTHLGVYYYNDEKKGGN